MPSDMPEDQTEAWAGGKHRGLTEDFHTGASPWCRCDSAYYKRGLVAHDCPLGYIEDYLEELQVIGLTIVPLSGAHDT